jgi:hypothetical protein
LRWLLFIFENRPTHNHQSPLTRHLSRLMYSRRYRR